MDIITYLKEKEIVLNEQQSKAVEQTDKNTLLLAVAGSGKTTVLVARLANLLVNKSVPASKILTLTFSREAAKDMAKRFTTLFPDLECPAFATIHSFCYSVINYYSLKTHKSIPALIEGTSIQSLRNKFIYTLYQDATGEYCSEEILEAYLNKIGYAKNMSITPSSAKSKEIDNELVCFDYIYGSYEKWKKDNKDMDYDDMLTFTITLFKSDAFLKNFAGRYDYINLDEAQDTSKIQHEIIDKLVGKNTVLFYVGDEDQSIYGFRGAYPQALLEFQNKHKDGVVLKMEENYRSASDIIEKANLVIHQNLNRFEKVPYSNVKGVNSIRLLDTKDYIEQYQDVYSLAITSLYENPEKTFAILYRNNESIIPTMFMLYKNNIQYYCKETNVSFFNNVIVRDILTFLKFSFCPNNLDLFRIIAPRMKFAKDDVMKIEQLYNNTPILDIVLNDTTKSFSAVKKVNASFHKDALTKILTSSPKEAVDIVMKKLDYKHYVDKEYSKTKASSYKKIYALQALAERFDTVIEFISELETFKEYIENGTNNTRESNLILSTFHSAKGLEYDRVALIDVMDYVFPSMTSLLDLSRGIREEYESEVRLFYVGITRAKEKLYCYNFRSGPLYVPFQSRFIDLLR